MRVRGNRRARTEVALVVTHAGAASRLRSRAPIFLILRRSLSESTLFSIPQFFNGPLYIAPVAHESHCQNKTSVMNEITAT